MTMSDPIADMITRIRNGQSARLVEVSVPCSNIHVGILKVLQEEGYIKSFEIVEIRKNISEIVVQLKYHKGKAAIIEISRSSRPGLRKYASVDELKNKKFFNALGVRIVSTPKGIMSDREARFANVGGEVLCNVF